MEDGMNLNEISNLIELTEYEANSLEDNKNFWDYIINFMYKSNDIFISCFPKTGTTLTLQMCHILRGGDMSFEDQHFVTPFINQLWHYGEDLSGISGFNFKQRVFKTHFPLSICNKVFGSKRYICLAREPVATFKSWYYFLKLKKRLDNDSSFGDFLKDPSNFPFYDYYTQLVQYYKCRNCKNVLFLFYEDFLEDPRSYIQRVAEFMEVDNYDLEEVVRMTSREFMMEHVSKFDENTFIAHMKNIGKPHHRNVNPGAKVTLGIHQERHKLTEEDYIYFKQQWEEKVYKVIGCVSYEELRSSVKADYSFK